MRGYGNVKYYRDGEVLISPEGKRWAKVDDEYSQPYWDEREDKKRVQEAAQIVKDKERAKRERMEFPQHVIDEHFPSNGNWNFKDEDDTPYTRKDAFNVTFMTVVVRFILVFLGVVIFIAVLAAGFDLFTALSGI